jgi:hypothetical protein
VNLVDRVFYATNDATGKTGYEIAELAAMRNGDDDRSLDCS